MIQYYSIIKSKISLLSELDLEKVVWCEIIQPSESELTEISQKFNINLDDLKDCLDDTERPRSNFDAILKNNMILLRVLKSLDLTQKQPTYPIGFFITPNEKIITIQSQYYQNDIIIEILNRQEIENMLSLLTSLLQIFITQLDKLSQKVMISIQELQDEILITQNVDAIQKPFQLNSFVIYLNTAMLGNKNALKSFFDKNKVLIEKNIQILEKYDDILTDIEQVYEMSSIFRDLLNNTLDAYASVINNNLSQIMKIVGSISLILMIPTMIASYYGMNVYLPGGTTPGDPTFFFILLFISFALSILTWLYFRKLKWL